MKATIESTTKTINLNGQPGRIWNGITESGIPFNCFISLIEVDKNEPQEEFVRELNQCHHASTELNELLKDE